MGLPRSKYVKEGQVGVYHCFSRCVRRAFLCGFDALTQRDFSHRKEWLVQRLRHLAAIFAIEVCAYAVMENHYHVILRLRPDIVANWSDWEVATRWLTLFPKHRSTGSEPAPPSEEEIHALTQCPERIELYRRRLCSLSWFMGRLNEFIARAANKEDGVKGRFWESRFKCQALLDEAAIASCMVYVDLNPIRAGLAATPEQSDFTSIQERIRAWRSTGSASSQDEQNNQGTAGRLLPEKTIEMSNPIPGSLSAIEDSPDNGTLSSCWLCPISSEPGRRGILPMTATEYFDLVDQSGRMLRSDKRGAIDADLKPILLRIGAKPDAWMETVSRFGNRFRLAAGLLTNLRSFADYIGSRWITGMAAARIAFVS